jgi:putative redox protein
MEQPMPASDARRHAEGTRGATPKSPLDEAHPQAAESGSQGAQSIHHQGVTAMPSVKSHHAGDMVFETQVGEHVILNDVPPVPEWGGKGRHPTPPDYFVASLSSCIAAFVQHYCNQSGVDATGMYVEVHYEKATDPAHLKELMVDVYLPNADIGKRAEAIRRVSGHCTVHETICKMEALPVSIHDKTGELG